MYPYCVFRLLAEMFISCLCIQSNELLFAGAPVNPLAAVHADVEHGIIEVDFMPMFVRHPRMSVDCMKVSIVDETVISGMAYGRA